ncbi:MAG: DNA mismatch repair protein MutS [Planctomycetaceae bacterium]|jgi:DNA mismatch repair protein MutS|nr:DNA mismatch repair protein MutS [Planctomycetaceae bacterium]
MLTNKFKTTPMLKQLQDAKQACPNALVLFRMGDFYELFLEDAKIAADVLGLALTSREKGPDAMPMAGFPCSQLDSYIAKLINAGFRVAVCEQMEDPKKAKGIVRREVVRVVTAGTVTEDTILDPRTSNFLAAVSLNSRTPRLEVGIAWIELSTGAFYAVTTVKDALLEHIARISPVEIIYSDKDPFSLPDYFHVQKTQRSDWTFNYRTAKEALCKQFKTNTLEGFGFAEDDNNNIHAICAAGAILDYLHETQRQTLEHIDMLTPYHVDSFMEIDETSRSSLELTRTMRTGKRDGTLLGVLDKCITPMGSRMLADWVTSPLMDIGKINSRLDAITELLTEKFTLPNIRDKMRKIYDLQRLMTRVIQNRCSPRDLGMITQTLTILPFFTEQLSGVKSSLLQDICNNIDPCTELAQLLSSALVADLPANFREGGFIQDKFDKELDELRDMQRGGKEWIAKYQAKEIERTGIASLRVGFTRVFGYYIEITNLHRRKIPSNYERKQTIKNAERYTTPELKKYEEKVITASERANEIELSIFERLCASTIEYRQKLQQIAVSIANLDVLISLAMLARQHNYCRPVLTDELMINIIDGRHPVIEELCAAGSFVPNDICVDSNENGMIQLITGPNMAGKSTFIRQAALLCIMAQIGSFIPARHAQIGICDRIFARVGASDEIARGYSTFMVEMIETARILNQGTVRSLVILDEIGRGTSTYDGISLAWAICEYLHNVIGCRTFFATHYHELTEISESLDSVRNLNVAVNELNDDVVFLHKIIQGTADKSYGLHVAKLAGIPNEVINRSREILMELERSHSKLTSNSVTDELRNLTTVSQNGEKVNRVVRVKHTKVGSVQFSLFGQEDHPVIDEIRNIDIEKISPIEAIQLLIQWKKTIL